ncbi:MAG: hypothetical protein A2Y78_05020 [Acidobacteria bacterium RBG_13_68_16]|nr:MAG: hypothetical protein A2Y78_05020 [Acidobacteria bacterium RBG_13_68_16]
MVPILTFLLMAVLAWIAVLAIQPPSAAPADAPADRFSAGRALPALREIARAAHPTGSAENTRVRETIVARLQGLGLAPEVQTATASFAQPSWGPSYDAATVRNVVARIRGTGGTRAVMLVAHYDSVPSGSGAGDDGSGVATLLETARALTAGSRMRNDVIVLVTDAEEIGLLGAKAFVDEHPWAGDVGVVVNFEARGTAGPSLMYRTTPHNGWLIRQLARSGAHPNASSLFSEASRRLPTGDSDHSVFKKAEISAFDFAFIDNGARYHSRLDDVEHLDPRSLQQHGNSALALARHFGNLDLTRTTAPDAIYFSLFGVVVAYPESWAVPLMVVAVLLTVFVVVLGFRAGRLTAGGLAVGAVGYLLTSAVSAGACELIWRALPLTGAVPLGSYGMAYNLHPYGVAFVALTIAGFVALYALVRNRIRRENLVAGALICWLGFTAATTMWFVGGSYLFLWPLVVALLTLGFEFARPEHSPGSQLVTWIPATVVVLLLAAVAPYLLLMLVADTMLLVTVPVVVVLGLLLPQIHIVQDRGRWLLPLAAMVVALAAFVVAAAHGSYDADHPRGDSLFYALNADTGKAAWASRDRAPDEWTSQLVAGTSPGSLADYGPFRARYLHREAPPIAAVPPSATVLEDTIEGGVRTLRLLIQPHPGTRVVWISVPGAEVLRGSVNGKPLPEPNTPEKRKNWQLRYTAPPPEGVELTMSVRAAGAPSLVLTDVADGLPEVSGTSLRPRPAGLMPSPSVPFDSSTLVTRTLPLGRR